MESTDKTEFRLLDACTEIAPSAIKWSALCFLGWKALTVLEIVLTEFSGKVTTSDVSITLAFLSGDGPLVKEIIFLFLVLNVFWFIMYTKERQTRRETVERLHDRIKDLELLLDPNRTSSSLMKDGSTNPTDL